MIKEGQRKKARYWGNYTVKKVVRLESPIICHSEEVGDVEFMPTLVQIEWETPPSADNNEFWFPYWVNIKGKEKYGLLQLLKEAIRRDYFDKNFLLELSEPLKIKLG